MGKKVMRAASFLLSLILLLGLLPGVSLAVGVVASGTLPGGLKWSYTNDRALKFTGTGPIPDYEDEVLPWQEYTEEITSVSFGSGVERIGSYALFFCVSLESVSIPSCVKEIGEYAFYGCSSLTSLTLANGVESIGRLAFCECGSLTAVTIPESVRDLAGSAFSDCGKLKSVSVESGNAWYSSVDGVLFNKARTRLLLYPCGKSGAGYAVPAGVIEIGDHAFDNCRLTAVTLPDSLRSIGYSAFFASDLSSITIPAGVTSIGEYAFCNCTGLSAVNVASGSAGFVSLSGVLYTKDKKKLIHYPVAKSGTGYTVAAGTQVIGTAAFADNPRLKTVTLPDSLLRIEEDAFRGCPCLTTVNFPAKLTAIGGAAFSSCERLTEAILPVGLKTLDYSAFSYCTSLKSVVIPATVTTLGEEAFLGCDSLQYLDILCGVTKLPDSLCFACGALKAVSIPASVRRVEAYAFSGCPALTDVYFGGSSAQWASVAIELGDDPQLMDAAVHEKTGVVPVTVKSVKSSVTTANVGSSIQWTAAAGGTEPLEYCFYLYKDGSLLQRGSYSASETFRFTPAEAGSYQVRAYAKSLGGATGSRMSAGVTVTAVNPGAIATLTAAASAGKITVKWSASANAASYVVQRRLKDAATWTTLSGSCSGTTYEDTTAVAGTVYQYRVRGRSGSLFGPFKVSGVVRAQAGSAAPGAISSVTASAAPGKTTVTWTRSANAAAYIIQRRVKDSDTWTTLKSNVTGLSFEDTTGIPGTVYQYRVRGRNGTVCGPFKVSSVVRAK